MDLLRLRTVNDRPLRPERAFVLYWMTAARRCAFNFGLERAAEHARALRRPLLVLEALRFDHPYASARMSMFVRDGMRDNAHDCKHRAAYFPYLEPSKNAGRGLLAALAAQSCVVVTDDYPTYFLPRMLASAARQLDVRLEAVDGNGLLPMVAADRMWPTARGFRSFLHKNLGLHPYPSADPLADLPPPAPLPSLRWKPSDLEGPVPISSAPSPTPLRGGSEAARRLLSRFVREGLYRYGDDRNPPDRDGGSHLSPYLHWGHIAPHEVARAVLSHAEGTGWWGAGENAEAFLDQLVTWRELGFNACHHNPDHRRYVSLPAWARATLDKHRGDLRDPRYTLAQLRDAETYDPLWNAAQRQLLREGRIHNYLRMLWGKKILEWTESPEQALEFMLELNDRWALDGRDPNSYSGIFWILGRYDRAWGPERPIFGTIRYMSSANTARKLAVKEYLARYA